MSIDVAEFEICLSSCYRILVLIMRLSFYVTNQKQESKKRHKKSVKLDRFPLSKVFGVTYFTR